MNSSYVCASCRRSLSQPRPQRVLQWIPRANFISLNNRTSKTITETIPSHKRSQNKREDGKPSSYTQKGRQRVKKTEGSAGDTLESLFRETLQQAAPAAKSEVQPTTVLTLYKNVDTLRKMLLQGGNEADAWLFFVEHFGPDAERHPFDKSIVSRVLLKDIIIAKRKQPMSQHLPSVTEVSTISYQLGLLNGADWTSLMVDLLEHIMKLKQDPKTSIDEIDRLVADLIGGWNVVCRPEGNLEDLPTYASTSLIWEHLPRIRYQNAIKVYRLKGLQQCFNLLTPPFNSRHNWSIPLIAVTTYRLLTNGTAEGNTVPDCQPLVHVLAKIIKIPGLSIDYLTTTAERPAGKLLIDYAVADFGDLKDKAANLIASSLSSREQTTDANLAERIEIRHPIHKRTQLNIQSMRASLDKSVREQDAGQADQLWQIASQWPIRPVSDSGDSKRGGGVLTSFLLNKFIFSYMALGHPNRAIDVWNTMVKNDIRPDSAAWTAMLSGARASRDAPALDKIWNQMRNTQIQLTNDAWTARIVGLIECRKVDQGIGAIEEMGKIWLAEAKRRSPQLSIQELLRLEESKVQGVTKPSIELVNMAISALIRKQKNDAAGKVLRWASQFGISPSAFTYNTLLRPLIRSGDTKAAQKLLIEMEAAGVQPDAGTFVTIIDETLRESAGYTVDEQQTVVEGIFDEMESLGLQVSKGLYGHIIHGLLEGLMNSGSRDLTVVNAVMARMSKQGWQPESIEYTELLRFHFNHDPPDLAAVDELIRRAATGPKALSQVFWDRVLEGYARAGESAKALAVYNDIRQRNRVIDTSKVAWRATQELVMALARNGEWEAAKTVVKQKVNDCGAPLPENHDVTTDGQHSQFAFWEVVRELDLLEEDK